LTDQLNDSRCTGEDNDGCPLHAPAFVIVALQTQEDPPRPMCPACLVRFAANEAAALIDMLSGGDGLTEKEKDR
jgi:hypothetical protein